MMSAGIPLIGAGATLAGGLMVGSKKLSKSR